MSFSASGPLSILFPLPEMLVPQFLAGRAPSSSSGLMVNVTSLGSGAPTQAEHPCMLPTPRCCSLRQTPHFLHQPLAAATPRTETSWVHRSGQECSEKCEDERWRTKEEVREETEQKAMQVIVKALVSLLSVMMLCYRCLPHTSHTAHRGGRDFSLTPSRTPLAPAPSLPPQQPLITFQELEPRCFSPAGL